MEVQPARGGDRAEMSVEGKLRWSVVTEKGLSKRRQCTLPLRV